MNIKAVGLFLLVGAVMASAAEYRNELERAEKAATRVIYEYPVDISPVMKWRATKQGDRPMTAWHYFTAGKITRAGAGEWEMEATPEGERTPINIILRNPPAAALREFNALATEYAALRDDAQGTAVAAEDARHADEVARANVIATPIPGGEVRVSQVRANERNFNNVIATRDATRSENVLAATEAIAAARDLRRFNPRGYRIPGEFSFRGYAVKTKEKHASGLPVYDHGTYR